MTVQWGKNLLVGFYVIQLIYIAPNHNTGNYGQNMTLVLYLIPFRDISLLAVLVTLLTNFTFKLAKAQLQPVHDDNINL